MEQIENSGAIDEQCKYIRGRRSKTVEERTSINENDFRVPPDIRCSGDTSSKNSSPTSGYFDCNILYMQVIIPIMWAHQATAHRQPFREISRILRKVIKFPLNSCDLLSHAYDLAGQLEQEILEAVEEVLEERIDIK